MIFFLEKKSLKTEKQATINIMIYMLLTVQDLT